MKRSLGVLSALFMVLAIVTTPVLAGRQSGPEQLAKGRGAVETTQTTLTFVGREVCFAGTCFFLTVATVTVTTEISQEFDFDARLGPHESSLLIGEGPSGRIRLTYDVTTTTVVAVTEIDFCTFPGVVVVGGCPTFGTTTTNESAIATATVTCLTVVQNRAAIGGHVTKFEGNFPPTRGILLNVTDNTVARQQVGGEDRFLAAFVPDVPYVCPAPVDGHPITDGDIYVDQS